MIATIKTERGSYLVDWDEFIDISIPMLFNGPQPNAYGVEPAAAKAGGYGELIGDTRRGGSCNFEQIIVVPHCNGTHTECVGHITNERISVRECLTDVFVEALLVTVAPTPVSGSTGSYPVPRPENDLVLESDAIETALSSSTSSFHDCALIVRTLPNNDDKLARSYGEYIPPYFTTEAMELLVARGFKHLLVDLPSIDRLYDDGRLSNHRIFWN